MADMGSSPSSPARQGPLTGNPWTKTFFFDPEADTPLKREHTFPNCELLSKIDCLTPLSTQRQITRVHVYTATHKKTRTSFLKQRDGTHIFLAVRAYTENWFSLELNNGRITIQQSQRLDAVTQTCRDTPRVNLDGPTQVFKNGQSGSINVTFGNLLEWLQAKSDQWRQSNCYDFAAEVFKYITETELDSTKHKDVCRDELLPDEKDQYYAYYKPEADFRKVGPKYWITADQVNRLLEEYVGAVDEEIKTVTAFKTPLSESQWTAELFYCLFIVFETESWWWSIEKNSEGLSLQRSIKQEAVRDNYRQAPRLSEGNTYWEITEVQSDTGNKTIKELITWLREEEWLFRPYNYLNSNCQHFAKAVFDHVSKQGILSIAT